MNKTFLMWLLQNLGCLSRVGGLVFVVAAIVLLVALWEPDSEVYQSLILGPGALGWTIVGIVFAVMCIIAARVAAFAHKNFDQIWASRNNWSRSKVSKYDSRFQSTVGTFFSILFAQIGLLIILGLIAFVIVGLTQAQ